MFYVSQGISYIVYVHRHKQEFVNFFRGAYYNIGFGWDVVVGLDGVVAEVVVFHGRSMHGCM